MPTIQCMLLVVCRSTDAHTRQPAPTSEWISPMVDQCSKTSHVTRSEPFPATSTSTEAHARGHKSNSDDPCMRIHTDLKMVSNVIHHSTRNEESAQTANVLEPSSAHQFPVNSPRCVCVAHATTNLADATRLRQLSSLQMHDLLGHSSHIVFRHSNVTSFSVLGNRWRADWLHAYINIVFWFKSLQRYSKHDVWYVQHDALSEVSGMQISGIPVLSPYGYVPRICTVFMV